MAERPNILLIMNDDMGYSDIGCYGGEIHTPNLDGLADNGLRFTQFYNTARCCPTRASLLTGLHPHQASVGHMMDNREYEGYRGDLNFQSVTIAEVLKTAGYATYMSGKWHITRHADAEGPKHSWPCQRGFDRFFGIITGAANYWKPQTLTRDNEQISVDEFPEDFFLTDAISDHAADYIRAHARANRAQPFFLYTAYTAPHWPLHAHEEDIEKYNGRFAAGWDKLREERLARMREMGILKPEWGLSDRDPSQVPWEDAENKAWQQRRMEVYAAQVDRMDQGIGRIVQALEESGQLDNTLIIFLADNGGCAEELGNRIQRSAIAPATTRAGRFAKATSTGTNARIAPVTTRDGRPVQRGNDPTVMPGDETTYQSYGVPWANVSNTPFRLYKHWVHEGGISTPFIVHWPNRITDKGALRDQPGQLTDVMATCLDIAGAAYPETHNGHDILPLEGTALTPIFDNRDNGKPYLIWEHEGNGAIRKGKWKLVKRYPGDWELYDIEADRSERHDLAQDHPDVVADLTAIYDAWAERCGIEPWDNILAKRG